GTKFEIYLSMQATAGSITQNGQGYSLGPRTTSRSGVSKFISTLVVNEMQTAAGMGNAVTDSMFLAESGTTYTQAGVAPEPATWLLMAFALPAFFLVRRARLRRVAAPPS